MTNQPGTSQEERAVALHCARLVCLHCATETPLIEYGYFKMVYHVGDDGLSECSALPILRTYSLLPASFKYAAGY